MAHPGGTIAIREGILFFRITTLQRIGCLKLSEGSFYILDCHFVCAEKIAPEIYGHSKIMLQQHLKLTFIG